MGPEENEVGGVSVHFDVWVQFHELQLRVQRVVGKGLLELSVEQDEDLAPTFRSSLQYLVQSMCDHVVSSFYSNWPLQEDLGAEPPVSDVDLVFGLFEIFGEVAEVLVSVYVPLGQIVVASGAERVEPVQFGVRAIDDCLDQGLEPVNHIEDCLDSDGDLPGCSEEYDGSVGAGILLAEPDLESGVEEENVTELFLIVVIGVADAFLRQNEPLSPPAATVVK